jgi:anti-sigma factor RsiW
LNALERWIEIEVVPPCPIGSPLLHRLVDGELPRRKRQEADAHVRACARCRAHLRLLELEEQAIRELAAPSPRRFVDLWAARLEEKISRATSGDRGAA